MIYTCYEMIRDCQADRAEGWSYLVTHYTPVMQRILRHYVPSLAGEASTGEILKTLRNPQSTLFRSLEPAPERWFVGGLRQHVLAAADGMAPAGEPGISVNLEVLTEALEPLTLLEKQGVWLEGMRYAPEAAGTLLRMEPRTVEKIREKASELLRSKLDVWRRNVLAENGARLGRLAEGAGGTECLPSKAFLDVLDGRTTWFGREEMERHVKNCWHCIDHFCRMTEVVELLRGVKPLEEAEAARLLQAMGVVKAGRKRWFARG